VPRFYVADGGGPELGLLLGVGAVKDQPDLRAVVGHGASSIEAAIWAVAALTAASGIVVLVRMYETHPPPSRPFAPQDRTAVSEP
jgi:hypothetical protein